MAHNKDNNSHGALNNNHGDYNNHIGVNMVDFDTLPAKLICWHNIIRCTRSRRTSCSKEFFSSMPAVRHCVCRIVLIDEWEHYGQTLFSSGCLLLLQAPLGTHFPSSWPLSNASSIEHIGSQSPESASEVPSGQLSTHLFIWWSTINQLDHTQIMRVTCPFVPSGRLCCVLCTLLACRSCTIANMPSIAPRAIPWAILDMNYCITKLIEPEVEQSDGSNTHRATHLCIDLFWCEYGVGSWQSVHSLFTSGACPAGHLPPQCVPSSLYGVAWPATHT